MCETTPANAALRHKNIQFKACVGIMMPLFDYSEVVLPTTYWQCCRVTAHGDAKFESMNVPVGARLLVQTVKFNNVPV